MTVGDLRALARLVAKQGHVDDETLNIAIYLIVRHTIFTQQDVDQMEVSEMAQVFTELIGALQARPQLDIQKATGIVDAVMAKVRANG